jgi:hypothetical protein
MLNGLYAEAAITSKYINIKNGRNELICRVKSIDDAKRLVEEVGKLLDENKEYFEKLVNAAHINGLYLEALEELAYYGNPKLAEEVLGGLEPRFSENHTSPNLFLGLDEQVQKILLDETDPKRGDVFYNMNDKKFYIFVEADNELYYFYPDSPESPVGYCCKISDVGSNIIPCYTIHQLWDIMEKHVKEGINLIKQHGMYKVYSTIGDCFGGDQDKLTALWYSTLNVIC